MVTERIIKADLSQEKGNLYFKTNQYDNYSRKYRLVITDNGIPRPFTAQKTIQLILQLQGDATPYYTGLLEDEWEDGYPVVTFTAEMLSKIGIVDFKFIIYEPGSPETISTRIQHLRVQKSLIDYEGIITSEEFNVLTDLIAQATTVPSTVADINALKDQMNAKMAEVDAQMTTYDTKFNQLSQNIEDMLDSITAYINDGENATAASAKLAESWAIGGTDSRSGEDTDNSKYYSMQAETAYTNAKAEADRASTYAGLVIPNLGVNLTNGHLEYSTSEDITFTTDRTDGHLKYLIL